MRKKFANKRFIRFFFINEKITPVNFYDSLLRIIMVFPLWIKVKSKDKVFS